MEMYIKGAWRNVKCIFTAFKCCCYWFQRNASDNLTIRTVHFHFPHVIYLLLFILKKNTHCNCSTELHLQHWHSRDHERLSISRCSYWPIWAIWLKHERPRAATNCLTTFLLSQKHRYSNQDVKLYDWNIKLVANRLLSCERFFTKWQFNKTLRYVTCVRA